MSGTGLQWCHGCQCNVKPTLSGECPRCGSMVRGPRIIAPGIRPREREVETELDFEPLIDFPPLRRGPIRTPSTGRLVLNPKVKGEPHTPLCPVCEQPIRRLEADNFVVEFRCGCDGLRRFEFPEQEEVLD